MHMHSQGQALLDTASGRVWLYPRSYTPLEP